MKIKSHNPYHRDADILAPDFRCYLPSHVQYCLYCGTISCIHMKPFFPQLGISMSSMLFAGMTYTHPQKYHYHRADSRLAPSQWETSLLCNDVSHWLGANLESALPSYDMRQQTGQEVITFYQGLTQDLLRWQISAGEPLYITILQYTQKRNSISHSQRACEFIVWSADWWLSARLQ